MAIFSAGFAAELPGLLKQTSVLGYAHASNSVAPELLVDWATELRHGSYSSSAEPGVHIAESWLRSRRYPLTSGVRNELVHLVRHAGVSAFRDWKPDTYGIVRYRPGPVSGLTAHLDDARFVLLVVVISVADQALLSIHDRSDASVVIDRWRVNPGDITLMWSTPVHDPLLEGGDLRPLHSVSGPDSGERYVVGFRQHG